MLKAAQLMKEKKHQEAENFLRGLISEAKESSHQLSVLKYLLIQNLLIQNKYEASIDAFKMLDEYKSLKLGVVSGLVTLFKHKNDKESVSNLSKLFTQAIDFFSRSNQNARELEIFVKENSNFQISCGNLSRASDMLERMRSLKPNDFKILSKLINIYSKIDSEKAKQYVLLQLNKLKDGYFKYIYFN